MAIFLRREGYIFSRTQTLAGVFFKRNSCTLAEGEMDRNSVLPPVDTSKWKKVNANVVGIKGSMISASSWTVMRILRQKGFDAYLVGGCVRDLLLQRAPKDFDVITTANLKEIRQQFNRAQIVGKRFPICQVWIKGSITEVSSFDTVAQTTSEDENNLERGEGKDSVAENAEENEKSTLLKLPRGFDGKDFNRWRNSMQRDFTINSLFFDPFDFKIFDYTNAMEDLKALKLRTLIPAQLSFEEDCARILRGLRIAARLDLSFSKDIETAIPKFVSSAASLDSFRMTMEMNYMLSYGASGPSILLLRKFNLLQPLLPFQAAYLEQASKASPLGSTMLMRLLSTMDKLVFCDQPADCRLWIALLAFHTALVRDPQDALVVAAFGSVLYHGHWKEAVRYAREHEKSLAKFAPEFAESSENRSDEDLAEAVSQFTFLLQDSVEVLTDMEDLQEALSLYPASKCSGRVFLSKKKAREVAGAFDDLVNDIESYESKREGAINYLSLGKGDPCEIRFVLGKIILETMTEDVSKQIDLGDRKSATKMQRIPAVINENDKSTISNAVENQNQSRVQKDREHNPEASLPKPKEKTPKRSRPNDSTTDIQHVFVVDKENDSSMLLNLAKNHHHFRVQKATKHGSEASVPEPKRKTSKRSKQEASNNNQEAVATPVSDLLKAVKKAKHKAASDNSLGELLNKLVGRSDTTINETIKLETSPKEKDSKFVSSEKTKRPGKRLAPGKLSSLFK